jgi:hypothetical protein
MEWFTHLGHGGGTEVWTVQDACNAYADLIQRNKGEKAVADLRARYGRWIMPDPTGKVPLMKLKRDHVRKFRHRLCDTPVTINTKGETRPRSIMPLPIARLLRKWLGSRNSNRSRTPIIAASTSNDSSTGN